MVFLTVLYLFIIFLMPLISPNSDKYIPSYEISILTYNRNKVFSVIHNDSQNSDSKTAKLNITFFMKNEVL
jgi:hypothetical protein